MGLKFCKFQRFDSNFTRGSRWCSFKKDVLKDFVTITAGKHLFYSLFLNCNFSCKFCKIFKNLFFTEPLLVTAFILQQLLALQFAIICSQQLASSEKSLVGKKFIHISQRFCRFRFFLFDKCLFILSVTQNVCCTLSSQPFCWLRDTWRHNFDRF